MEPRISDTGAITTVHFVLLAILAAATIAAILWGMRLKRQREAASLIEEERFEEEPAAIETPAPSHRDIAAPPPVAPAPPPIAAAPTPLTPRVSELEAPAAEPSLANEPIAAAAPFDASPATLVPGPEAAPAPADGPVIQMKGVGARVAARLAELGITTVGQIAALDAGEAEALDAQLGPFTGRMARDRWVEQARFLAAGDKAGFEAVFGRL